MAEYIEREALINHVEDLPTWGADGSLLDREDVIGSIENRLAADVAPVRHGRWEVKVGMNFFKERNCPVCKKRIESNCWNYCSNCGCKMDGGEP